LNNLAFAPPPSLHPLRPSPCWLVRGLRRYYAAIRLPECVHRRRSVTSFPTRSALDCSAGTDGSMADAPWLSRLPRKLFRCMLRSTTPPGSFLPCQSGRNDVAFHALEPCRHPEVALFQGSILGLHLPLSTLHDRRYHRPRMTRGRGGWLDLPRRGLAPLTACRF
jgi:hypothetical protein